MTTLKIYNLEDRNDSHPICTLLEGEHLVGRGPTLNITDKRVSRNHAQFIIRDHGACIKSVHINPCFFKTSEGRNIQILKKDEMIEMKDGDTFSFLADQCWYRVKITFDEAAAVSNIDANVLNPSKRSYPEASSEPSKRKKVDEDKTSLNSSYVSPSRKCTSPKNLQIPVQTETTDDTPLSPDLCESLNEELIASPGKMDEDKTSLNSSYVSPSQKCTSPKNLQIPVQTETTDDTPLSPDLCESLNEELIADILPPTANVTNKDVTELPSSLNKNLAEGSPQSPPSKLYPSDESLKNTEVKEELSASDEIMDHVSEPRWDMDETADIQDVEEETKVKEETEAKAEEDKKAEEEAVEGSSTGSASNQNAGASCTNTNPSTTRREHCWYSGSCYRKNPQHRSDFSHPGDKDYESDANDERPDCPFGASCYRTNKGHRIQYKHAGKPAPKPIRTVQAKNSASDNDSGEDSTDSDAAGTTRKKRKAALKKVKYTDTPEDDYDFDDPFINDDSSDDFELSDDEDEESTDFDSQNVDDEDTENKKRLLKDAKKFLKKNRQKKNKK